MSRLLLAGAMLMASTAAGAGAPATLLDVHAQAAAMVPGFAGFSASRGKVPFHRPARDWSCASCHTDDPRAGGRHVVTGKSITPLSPVADFRRFTDPSAGGTGPESD